jgi:iron complex transport system permease protein
VTDVSGAAGATPADDATPRSGAPVLLTLSALLLATIALSILVGRYPRPYWLSPELLASDEMARNLVLGLRLPRLLVAVVLGAVLAGAGFTMQMVFRNPLIEPGFLGVSQGAAFGAALAIVLLGGSGPLVQGLATLFALLGLGLTWLLSRAFRFGGHTLRLILSGIAVSALFSSGVGVLKFMADPLRQLPDITFWLLGGLWGVTWKQLAWLLPVALPALLVLLLFRWRLNVISLDDETAFALGVSVRKERFLLLFVSVAATAVVVSVAGMVGWIGLITPHLARRLQGADARRALPAALLLGALLSLVCDDLARTLIAGEIPLGILTSLLGTVVFAWLMVRQSGRARA